MKMTRTVALYTFVLTVTASVLLLPVSQATAQTATETIKGSIDGILAVLKAPELKGDDKKEVRRQKIREIAQQRFDYDRMSQLSLGKHWRGRTPEEKKAFTARFCQLIESTYISKLEMYTNEKMIYAGEQLKKKKNREYAKIDTRLVTVDGAEVPIEYMMHRQENTPWLVFDIKIEGVSMVNNYRSQFSQILDKKPFSELIKELDAKNSTK